MGGIIRPHRDRRRSTDLVQRVRACAASLAILVCGDGLASDVTAFPRVFRHTVRTGRRGRPRLVVAPRLLIGQVIKQDAKRRVVGVVHRVVSGTAQAMAKVLRKTRTGTVLNTATIERLKATFRSALAPGVRRERASAQLAATASRREVLGGLRR